ncbi:hypothetical protein EDD16DRAFT_1703785 [Pisolithus croceorrhizus]|nr:hypothetical protein EDD16DRAFT_1703785 [Pisolithus croceorrhizus]
MPRSSRSRPAPAAKPAPAPSQQTRGAHTAAMPPPSAGYGNPAHAPAPHTAAAPQTKEPGLFSQMAATAGGVAVGSTIGHGLSSMLFGGSSSHAAAPAEQPAPVQQQTYNRGPSCEIQAKEFTQCLEKADLQSCSWYLEQLKAVSRSSWNYQQPITYQVIVPSSSSALLEDAT